eukprot:CAMPEP_0119111418 /NCGR_PEP_ID=MMETSP1180-20130426/35548_1 /TAXON_ID=3052 ORGANISM="Chlamydomonas cf sp, Strain CCMP681" /NCGR_SAMPLE_ID=MMETSP1180 /ASSEMBLY_ACC=CAM_ASM_000741 /LENGTH=40 /DNA_ID= /DNA_START= /DNA_END= /DNA_ORIENTATION=
MHCKRHVAERQQAGGALAQKTVERNCMANATQQAIAGEKP